MKPFIFSFLFVVVLLSATPVKRKFTGVVTDSMCATADHSGMRMGPTDAECATACVEAHGALYVLYDGKQALILSDQKPPEKFAGKRVTVSGSLNAASKTIQVQSIVPAR